MWEEYLLVPPLMDLAVELEREGFDAIAVEPLVVRGEPVSSSSPPHAAAISDAATAASDFAWNSGSWEKASPFWALRVSAWTWRAPPACGPTMGG